VCSNYDRRAISEGKFMRPPPHVPRMTAKAREMVERMRGKGDNEGADTWLRIIVAIGELGEPPTEARRSHRARIRTRVAKRR